ncbi:EF-hand [Mollisia scopiformis]|uniref:Calmodulin n=1 Tax=Mollisia scopiformis TaxID=149040 RepID=A0A194XQS3_MOLSC|nr:EF-hand [Mollisia scopiformis]KUJ22077.1 EF-hand [Mollisia scopiformis]
MPARRRAAEPAETSTPKARQSRLAKENKITGEEENEIKEAFELFSIKHKGEKDGVIPIDDVRRAMSALDIPPDPEELEEFISILDPEEEGFAVYSSFVAICALKFHKRSRTSDSHGQEVEDAFRLFTAESGEDRITLGTLKRVAKALKEDVDEDVLRDMILEANKGVGVGKGVDKEDFEGIMRKAGVWR